MTTTDNRAPDENLAPAYWLSLGVLGPLVAASSTMWLATLMRLIALVRPLPFTSDLMVGCFAFVLVVIAAAGAFHRRDLRSFLERHATVERTLAVGVLNMAALAVVSLIH